MNLGNDGRNRALSPEEVKSVGLFQTRRGRCGGDSDVKHAADEDRVVIEEDKL